MTIKILGSGCPNCQTLEDNAKQAAKELGLEDILVEHVYEIDKIVAMGVMATPAIIINDQIKAAGRIPNIEEIKGWLKK
jgi:small redox-active disulfide protein 2